MSTFVNPKTGNLEIYETKPEGYFTEEEWQGLNPELYEFNPGVDYEKQEEGWRQVRFSKKDFLLLCGIENIAKLNAARKDNVMAETVYTLLMAAEFIDVTDQDTIQMVQLLATETAGNVLTAEDVGRILQGRQYVEEPHA